MKLSEVAKVIRAELDKWDPQFIDDAVIKHEDEELIDSLRGYKVNITFDPSNFPYVSSGGLIKIYFIEQDTHIIFRYNGDLYGTTVGIVIIIIQEVLVQLGYVKLAFKTFYEYIRNRIDDEHHGRPIWNNVGDDYDRIDMYGWCRAFIGKNDIMALTNLLETNWVRLVEDYQNIDPKITRDIFRIFDEFNVVKMMKRNIHKFLAICDVRGYHECMAILLKWKHEWIGETEESILARGH
jgi:hypothetical protein